MRRVMVTEWVLDEETKKHVWRETREANFHQFGVEYEEFESGPGNYSTAIVEYDDGKVDIFHASKIRFLDR